MQKGAYRMARDDYFVIVYRLLKYLYDCLKKSKKPDAGALEADFFGIAEEYWQYIIRNILNDGYIEGVARFDGGLVIRPDVSITPKGIQHLEENSIFQKIKGAAKDIADIMPI